MDKVRIDKWLWSVRLYKSRTIATDACKAGKVRIGNTPLKASHQIVVGDELTVKKEGFNFQFRALQLIEKRVGAPIAVTCYEDITPAEEREKYSAWFFNGAPAAEKRERGAGRPTKKDRREMDDFKGDIDFEEMD